MFLESLLRKLSGIPRQTGCGKSVSAYKDNITLIITEVDNLRRVAKAINEYKMMMGVKINQEKSVSLQLDTWRGKSIPPVKVVGHWTEDSIKLLRISFGLDLQIENYVEVSNRVTHIVMKLSSQWIFLKGKR